MKNLKEYLLTGLCGLALAGCNSQEIIKPIETSRKIETVSYKLEDLCDTKTDLKHITLNVYIEPSNFSWMCYRYKDDIFGRVQDFFKEYNIDCKVVYSEDCFDGFSKSNEFGLEIWDSKLDKEKRYRKLSFGIDFSDEEEKLNNASYAIPRRQFAVTCGNLTGETYVNEDILKRMYFKHFDKKENREIVMKGLTFHYCHEILHCMGLPHINNFESYLAQGPVPNIMNNKKDMSDGCRLDSIQKYLIHSFIAGNYTHKAFDKTGRNLAIFSENIAEANNLGYIDFLTQIISSKNSF